MKISYQLEYTVENASAAKNPEYLSNDFSSNSGPDFCYHFERPEHRSSRL